LRKFIAAYKQKTGFEFKKKLNRSLWQINYYEHILRREEEIKKIARYIFGNPVRKGIVDNYRKYPFLGSFMFKI